MRNFIRAALVAATILLVGAAGSASATQPVDLHCAGYNDPAYTKVESPGNDVVLPAGTSACVKGGLADPTAFVADGIQTLGDYLPGKYDVSYVVIYSTPEATPSPSATPSPTSTPSPTLSPTPSPSPSSQPSEQPSPSSEPTPSPTPSSSSTPTPSETPPPSATPTPAPSATTPSSTPLPTLPPTDTDSASSTDQSDSGLNGLLAAIGGVFILYVLADAFGKWLDAPNPRR